MIENVTFDGEYMRKTVFTTLHPAGTNADLMKDEGQIPYTLCLHKGMDASLVTCHIDKKVANIYNVPGLHVEHYPLLLNHTLTGIVYLIFHSHKIDWLNIYFAGRQALIWMRLYKLMNRDGHIYLKLDLDFRGAELYEKNRKERRIFTINTQIADIISAESTAIIKRIEKYSSKRVLLVEDGISKLDSKPVIDNERENRFITVGRLGTYQKATDILLAAFARSAKFHNWDLILIGNVDDGFREYIRKFYTDHSELRNRVIFKGVIRNREELYKEYCHSKVFVLPSRWESYGISSGEALYCGCHLILSDSIPPASVMTLDGKFGTMVKSGNINDLSDALIEATKKEYVQSEIDEMSEYADKMFSWERICEKLYAEMNRIEDESRIEKLT